MTILIALHLLSATIWVGGMFFAYMILRPAAAALLEPPVRLTLWANIFARFFPWVWFAVLTLFATGYSMNSILFNSFIDAPLQIHIMHGLAWLMTTIFAFVFFVPYSQLRAAVNKQEWPRAGSRLGMIRSLIATNMLLGLLLIGMAAAGRYW